MCIPEKNFLREIYKILFTPILKSHKDPCEDFSNIWNEQSYFFFLLHDAKSEYDL